MTLSKALLGFAAASMMMASAGAAGADEAMEKAVKARQAVMTIYSFNLGQLGAMAKGEAEYDAAVAEAAAQNLLAAATMKNGAMWPAGSGLDNADLAGKTRAKPEIWSTYPKVAEAGAALVTAAEAMVVAAGTDLDSLKGAMGAVGKSCGGCHEPFRAKDK